MSESSKKLEAAINKYIRPLTFPVAIKFFKEGEELPEKAKIPTKHMGYPIAVCQAMTIARKFGWTIAMYQEDQACPLSHIILGYAEEPDLIKDGSVVKPLYVDNDEAAMLTQSTTPKMPTADTHCIVLAPLDKATFDPDVVVCYGNAAQITRCTQGALYKGGGYIESRFAGRGACGGEITVPFSQDKCNIICPGGGERVFALTADDELAFAIPANWFERVAEGIEGTHKGGVARIPTPAMGVMMRPQMPPKYWELEKHLGLREAD